MFSHRRGARLRMSIQGYRTYAAISRQSKKARSQLAGNVLADAQAHTVDKGRSHLDHS